MWNKALQLHAARRLEQNNSVALETALQLRPQIFDVCAGDDLDASPASARSRAPANSPITGYDICPRAEGPTGDLVVQRCRRRAELPHGAEDDDALSLRVGSLRPSRSPRGSIPDSRCRRR